MKEEPLNRTAPLLVVATHNEDKLNEIREILRDLPFRICSQGDLNIHTDVEESGASFSANALLKARAVQRLCPGAYVIGDDSGLCVMHCQGRAFPALPAGAAIRKNSGNCGGSGGY